MAKRRKIKADPGIWVADLIDGMPTPCAPGPLPDGPMTNEEVLEVVCYEGLGFSLELIGAERLKDNQLQKLWKTAQADRLKIMTYLEKF